MNNLKVKTKIDFKALKYANLYLMRVKRKSYLIFSILCAACIFGAVYSLISGGMNNLLFAIIFFVFALYAVYTMLTFEKKVDNSLIKFFSQNAPMTQYIALDEDNISICLKGKDGLEKVSYDWAYVNEIHKLKDYYLMFLAGGMPIIIERNEETVIEGTMAEVDELIKNKGELKPYRVYEKELVKNFVDPVQYLEAEEVDLDAVLEKLNEVVVKEEPKEEVLEENAEDVEVKAIEGNSEEESSEEESSEEESSEDEKSSEEEIEE